ncbi:MAG: protein kinase [Ardenticatenales bacterium]|nr:protein kinase [Ardenticatenales bacterium]
MHPQMIGRYQLLSELGRGGMAVVYRAHDPLFGRDVALKALLFAYFRDPVSRKRFEREARVIAALEHPFIVPVYDFGQDEEQPYLVMRYLSGGTLKERLDNGPLSLASATAIINRLAQALDHAHEHQVIHRDLKPGNVLFDQYENAYLSDFGIARLVDQETKSLTGSGVIGTPAFMSPEQIYGDRPVDRRSDVYALGTLLYLMLSGKTPFDADTPAKLMMQHLLERPPDIRHWRPDLPPALADIIEQALAKEPDERFPRASALAAALAAVPQSEATPPPVTMRTPPPISQRPKVTPAEETGPLPALPVEDEATGDLPELPSEARHSIKEMPPPLIQPRARPVPPQALPVAPIAAESASTPRNWRLYGGIAALVFLVLAGLFWLPSLFAGPDEPGEAAAGFPSPPSNTATPTRAVTATNASETTPQPTATVAANVTARPGAEDAVITAANVAELVTYAQIGRGTIEEILRAPAGDLLAVAGGDGLWLYDAITLETVAHLDGHARTVRTAAWSPDGRLIASASDDGAILVWDVAAGEIIQQFSGHTDWVRALRWSPDGASLLSGSSDGTVRLWDVGAGGPGVTMAAFTVSVRSVAWAPAGQGWAAGLQTGELVFYGPAGAEQTRVQADDSPIITLAWADDSNRLAAGSIDGQLSLWEAAGSTPIVEVNAHLGAIFSLSWSADGARLLTTGNDNMARIWNVATMTATELNGHTAPVTGGAWLDENSVITGGIDGVLRTWASNNGSAQRQIEGHMTSINSAAWAPNGAILALGLSDDSARIWSADGQAELLNLAGHSSWVSSLSFAPDSSRLLTADFNGQIRLWDTESGDMITRLGTHRAIVNSVGWSVDGQYAASGGKDQLVRIWDTADLSQPQFITLTHTASVEALAFSPDGALLATGAADGTLLIWDWQERLILSRLDEHREAIRAISWLPDGTRLATSSNDGTVRIWDLDAEASELVLREHDGWVNSVSWSPNGQLLASGGFDGTVNIWSASTGELLHALPGGHYAVWAVSWSPDGTILLAGSGDGTAHLWSLPIIPSAPN